MVDLAPRAFGRIFDDALAVYRANGRAVLTVGALFVFPVALVNGVAQVFYTRGLLALVPVISDPSAPVSQIFDLEAASMLANAALPVYLLGRLVLASSLYVGGVALIERRGMDWRELLRAGFSRYLMVVAVSLALWVGVSAVALVAGLSTFFLLGLPGLVLAAWLALRFALAPVVTAAESCPFTDAFRRSWRLTRGSSWRTLGFVVLQSFLAAALEAAIGSFVAVRQVFVALQDPESLFRQVSVGWKVVEGLLTASSATLVLPFAFMAWYLYYLDLRARREGLDLVLRAGALADAS